MYLNNNLLKLVFSLFVATTGCLTSYLHAEDFDDEIDFELTEESFASPAEQSMCMPADVVNLLLDLDALCILKQDFYLHTNELNQRSLLDYGLFLPDKFYAHPWQIGAHFFYNQTSRDNFTRKSTALCSYLAIFNESLLQEIQNRIREFNPGIELQDAVPLFANATVQERRLGIMFNGMRRWGDYRFRFLFPFYYIESNLYLTPEEIDDIQAEFGVSDPTDDIKFARKYLIADKIGFGDTRLNFDFPLSASPHVTTKLGFQATLPTAFALKKGLYGSSFKKMCRGPILDFCELFDLAVVQMDFEAVQAIALAYAQAALEQFNANLIELPLGNGGHFGLGIYMRSKTKLNSLIHRPWADNISIRSRISFEYLFPRRQDRYFIECSPSPCYEALGLNRAISQIRADLEANPAYAQEVLTFLQTQFTDKIFPFSLSTRVRPGMVFRWMSKYMYETDADWGWYLGTDNWLITREKLSGIIIPEGFPQSLNLKIAQKPFAYQFGVLGSLFWKRPRNLLVSLNGQYNFGSVGIGDDFLISINIELDRLPAIRFSFQSCSKL